MANLFPIGTVSPGSNDGIIGSISYSYFEPNNGVMSRDVPNILTSVFEQQTISTRKKANPYLSITYDYNNIFAREYNQIEHFVNYIAENGLYSFYVVDLSRGITPTSITLSGSDWKVYIPDTRYWVNSKVYAFVYASNYGFQFGSYDSITTNSFIIFNTSYGDLSLSDANSYAKIYPVYEVYCSPNPLNSFKKGPYIPQDIDLTNDGGFMRSGTITFTSKYPSL